MFVFEDRATFSCRPGYYIDPDPQLDTVTITCLAGGRWSRDIPVRCKRK